MRIGSTVFGVLIFLASASVHAQLSSDERRIVAWVDENMDEIESLIERTVNINSGSMNFDGVREVAAVMQAEFDELGFETEWLDMAEVNRSGHLFARYTGPSADESSPKILMIGHLDTVFAPDDAFQTYIRDDATGYATGPGVQDMKSGNVMMLYAMKAMEAIGVLDEMQVIAAYTGDEENPGAPLDVTRAALIEAGRWADIALGFENSSRVDGVDYATISRRGFAQWSLEVTGHQAHSSQIFSAEVGAGAVFEAARILSRFYEEVRGEEYLTFNAGSILGGTDVTFDAEDARGTVLGRANVVPRRVLVQGEVRTLSGDQLDRARAKMQEIVAEHLPNTDATFTMVDSYPAMAPTEANQQLAQVLSEINQDLGGDAMPVLDPLQRGAADISFVAPYTSALAGLGGPGDGGHSPRERLDVSQLPMAMKRAAILLYRLREIDVNR